MGAYAAAATAAAGDSRPARTVCAPAMRSTGATTPATRRAFDRNYLRRSVLPLIRRRGRPPRRPSTRSARHLAEARRLLERAASPRSRMRVTVPPCVSACCGACIAAERDAVQSGSPSVGCRHPITAACSEICGPLLAARGGIAVPKVRWRGAELRRHVDRLFACSVTQRPSSRGRAVGLARAAGCPGRGGALGLVRDRQR